MRTLFLHAGMHKTGTTQVQHTLFRNRAFLREQGLGYLDVGHPDMEANHSVVLFSLFSARAGSYHMNLRHGITPGESLERHNARLRAALEERFTANRLGRYVLSGEDVSALTEDELGRLKAFLELYFERIRVILYLRHPGPWMTSMAQQGIKTEHRLATLEERPPRPEYRDRLEKFLRLFGREAVDFRLYRRDGEPGWDVLADFLEAIGSPELAGRLTLAPEANQAVSAPAVEAIDALNAICPFRLADGSYNPKRSIGAVLALVKLGGPRFDFTPRPGALNEVALAADIDWVRRETGIDLDPRVGADAAGSGTPVLGAERAAEIAGLVNEACLRHERAVRSRDALAAETRQLQTRAQALAARVRELEAGGRH